LPHNYRMEKATNAEKIPKEVDKIGLQFAFENLFNRLFPVNQKENYERNSIEDNTGLPRE
jgi:hypothetical protein